MILTSRKWLTFHLMKHVVPSILILGIAWNAVPTAIWHLGVKQLKKLGFISEGIQLICTKAFVMFMIIFFRNLWNHMTGSWFCFYSSWFSLKVYNSSGLSSLILGRIFHIHFKLCCKALTYNVWMYVYCPATEKHICFTYSLFIAW